MSLDEHVDKVITGSAQETSPTDVVGTNKVLDLDVKTAIVNDEIKEPPKEPPHDPFGDQWSKDPAAPRAPQRAQPPLHDDGEPDLTLLEIGAIVGTKIKEGAQNVVRVAGRVTSRLRTSPPETQQK